MPEEINIEQSLNELKEKVNSKISEATKGLATKDEMRDTLNEIHKNFDTAQTAIKEQADRLEKAIDAQEKQGELITMLKENGGNGGRQKSLKEIIFDKLSCDEYKYFAENPTGRSFAMKAVGDMTSGGNLSGTYPVIVADRRREPLEILDRPRFLREVMNVVPTTSDKIDYVKEQGREGAPTMKSEVAASEQLDFNLVDASVNVERLPAHFTVSKNMLNDIPYLSSMIARTGTNRLRTVEDYQILFGDGSTPNLQGITGSAATFAAGNFSNSVKSANETDVLRVAKNIIDVLYYKANLILLNPEDITKMDLEKDSNGQYVMFGQRYDNSGNPMVYRIPIFETTAMTAGKYLIGDFQNGVEIADRMALEIALSESHSDNFTKNKVTIRLEERIGLPIYRDDAFVYGTFEDDISDITI